MLKVFVRSSRLQLGGPIFGQTILAQQSKMWFARSAAPPTVGISQHLPKPYDPKQSKYSKDRETKIKEINVSRSLDKQAPAFLKNEEKFQEFTADTQSFELKNPEEMKYLSAIERNKDKEKPQKAKPTAELIEQIETQKRLQNFDRFNQDFVDTYMEDRRLKRIPEINKAKQQEKPLEDFINKETVGDFSNVERLSKRMARMGVCSRRQAEKLMEAGMVKVDGKVVTANCPVTSANIIEVKAKTGHIIPVKQDTRVWLYHKPMGMVTTHRDPQQRQTVFDQLKKIGLNIPHVISVGRLDFLSEGLLIITNDGDLARALEMPTYSVERQYRVRVFGRTFDDAKLAKIRQGFTQESTGRRFGPYIAEVEKRQSTNTWIHMKLWTGKNNEIRRVMRRLSLRVNRLQRIRYGPYHIGLVPEPNDLQEVPLAAGLKRLLSLYYKQRTQQANTLIQEQENEKTIQEARKAFGGAKQIGETPDLVGIEENEDPYKWQL